MPSWGLLLLLFPWARNFTPIASAVKPETYCILCIRAQLKSSCIADVVIPVKKISKNYSNWLINCQWLKITDTNTAEMWPMKQISDNQCITTYKC